MKLLILNSQILAAGILLDHEDSIFTYTADGKVDAIYPKHVIEGWQIVDRDVPEDFTCAGYTDDGVQVVKKPPVVIPPTASEIETAIQARLDTFAQSWGYNDIASAATYVGSSVSKFNSEGTVLRNWRDQTWLTVETVDAEIQAGTRPYPSTISEALSALPPTPVRPS